MVRKLNSTIILTILILFLCLIYSNISIIIKLLNFILKNNLNNNLTREINCLNYIKKYSIKYNSTSVLNIIDKFGWEETFLMNIGDIKGEILIHELNKKKPKNILEVGTYIGYSAIRISSQLKQNNLQNNDNNDNTTKSRFISLDISSTHLNYAKETVEYAGLSDYVTFLEGTVTTTLKSFVEKENIDGFDFVFLDHHKKFYLSDLKYLLSENLLKPGAIIVADNVLLPGSPDYWYFISFDPRFVTKSHFTRLEYLPLPDVVTVSQYIGE